MIVVTANWALTDGSLVTRDRSRIAAWFTSLRRAVLRAGWRRDGSYHPVDRVDVVLAGDTFDWLASTRWGGTLRPWHAGHRAAEARRQVMATSAVRAADVMGRLARLARCGVAVPTTDRRGRPRLDAPVTVPVRIACLTGDRDAWLDEASPWIAARGGAAGVRWSGATVVVEHGSHVDPFYFDPEEAAGRSPHDRGRPPTIAESLTVDLLVRFAAVVRERGDESHAAIGGDLVAVMTEIHPREWPRALASRLDRAPPAARGHVADAWRRAVDAWRREVGRDPPACDAPSCPWDALASRLTRVAPATAHAANEPTDPFLAPGPPCRADVVLPGFASSGVVVLGHPPSAGAPPGPQDRDGQGQRIVCLGHRPVRRLAPVGLVGDAAAIAVACVGPLTDAAGPSSVVIREDADPPAVEWLDAGPHDAHGPPRGAVDHGVIDAA